MSSKRTAEEALHTPGRLLKSLTDASLDAIYIKDRKSRWLFALQAVSANSILSDKSKPEQLLRSFRYRRNPGLMASAFFFVSTLPMFWSWTISPGFPIRLVFWLATLFLPLFRHFWENSGRKRVNQTRALAK